jgi:hypothetical protein
VAKDAGHPLGNALAGMLVVLALLLTLLLTLMALNVLGQPSAGPHCSRPRGLLPWCCLGIAPAIANRRMTLSRVLNVRARQHG